ncbi:MAG: hypothetical protein JHD16_06420 [Solirubrobacteraceae bacterium]|nr:hypothetical protein [Solirubrobacteraceae bacterium]
MIITSRSAGLRRTSLAVLLAASALATGVSTANASAGAPERTETPIVSASPQTDVAASLVRIHVPMPASAAPHPAACDWIAYQRFRRADGPADATQADAVAVLQPGILEGATAFDPVARNTVREAARRGKSIEVWAIDRRANCLEDKVGLEAVERTGDPTLAIDYYYRGKAIDGKTFAGYRASDRVLADIGLAQTINDWNAVITRELPDQAWREQHVICGGHSLGGILTEIYASWDFDGNPKTTADAGYRQCAGFMAFDTTLNAGITERNPQFTTGLLGQLTSGALRTATQVSVRSIKAGTVPRHVDLLGISPETMNALELVGTRADQDPEGDATAIMQDVPKTKGIEALYRLAGSPNLASWLGGKTSLRDLRYSNMALLGQNMDDNGAIYGLVRTSFGYFDGVPLQRNRTAQEAQLIPGLGTLFGKGPLMLPQRLTPQPIARWKNYDELGTGSAQLGKGVTTPGSEVTDANEFARILHEGPVNLTENYFPIRMVVELGLLGAGDRSGTLSPSVHVRASTRKPRLAVIAGNGLFSRQRPVDPQVIAPGYEHLDVLTAAERQNNGLPEPSSQAFADLIDDAVGE